MTCEIDDIVVEKEAFILKFKEARKALFFGQSFESMKTPLLNTKNKAMSKLKSQFLL